MSFYELPGMLINPDHIIAVNTANENGYILHSVSGGEYHLSADQTEAFNKLSEKDGKSETLSLRKRADKGDITVGEGTVHAPANETFVPPIAENHPLNDIPGNPPPNQATDVSIKEPRLESPVIDASGNAPAVKNDPDAKAAKPLTNSDVKGETDKDKDKK